MKDAILYFIDSLLRYKFEGETAQWNTTIFLLIDIPILIISSIFYQLSDIKRYSKYYIFFNIDIISILLTYIILFIFIILDNLNIYEFISKFNTIIIILISIIKYLINKSIFYRLFNMILVVSFVSFISFRLHNNPSIYIAYISIFLIILIDRKYLFLLIYTIVLIPLLILRFYNIYLLDGFYFSFVLYMPLLLFIFAFGKFCIFCFKYTKRIILEKWLKQGGRVYRQPNGEDIGYRPVTKSTPALDKMRSNRKIHEDEDK